MAKHLYLVELDDSVGYPEKVVDHYVSRALRGYVKHDYQKAFDCGGVPLVTSRRIDGPQDVEDLQDHVMKYLKVIHKIGPAS